MLRTAPGAPVPPPRRTSSRTVPAAGRATSASEPRGTRSRSSPAPATRVSSAAESPHRTAPTSAVSPWQPRASVAVRGVPRPSSSPANRAAPHRQWRTATRAETDAPAARRPRGRPRAKRRGDTPSPVRAAARWQTRAPATSGSAASRAQGRYAISTALSDWLPLARTMSAAWSSTSPGPRGCIRSGSPAGMAGRRNDGRRK